MPTHRPVRFLLLLCLFLASGCGLLPQAPSNNKSKLEGTRWVNEPGQFAGKHFIAGAFTLDFRGDNTFYWRFSDQIFTGSFSYGPGDLVYFTLTSPFMGRTDWKEVITISGDVMVMGGEDGITITFNRYKTTPTVLAPAPPQETAKETPRPPPAATTKRNSTKPEELVQGEWEVGEAAIDGKIFRAEAYKDCRIVITADKLVFLGHGKPIFEAQYKCDFTQQPAHLDMTYLTGDKKGKQELGVIQVTEKSLQFTLAEPGQPRPKEFNAPQGWHRQRLLLYFLK